MNMSIGSLIMNASLLVQLVMLILLLASVSSWIVIFRKRAFLREMRGRADRFENLFWSGGRLTDIYEALRRRGGGDEGVEGLFRSGYEEYSQARGEGRRSGPEMIAAVQRALRVAQMREIDKLESGLAFLATVGSTSPYIGLFGTVWGIMNAFIGLGNVKQATIALVAPGIAEALVATAMGLLAAIPAVIAYNTFTNLVERLESRFHAFSEEFIGIVERGVQGGADERE